LAIPGSPVEFQEPSSKLSQLLLRKRLDLLLELLNFAHAQILSPASLLSANDMLSGENQGSWQRVRSNLS